MMKNTFLTLFFTVYCLSVFSSAAIPSLETNFSEQETTEGTHLAELSKVLCPQTISVEGYGVSIAPATPDFDGGNEKAFIATQFLSKLTVQNNISSFKASKTLDLQFPSVDIIFPFHNFW
ncbi:hypothetical protein [Brumimicrobium oceani]|uniref:Uncharacterized protein n=1 Tax=Brumimicrobium oceani TaxID=2100725 RepID=A0A2U2X0B2_9FLAO|nr:hypothetical protein [Brumimicrobium oceani]PWH81210.1 hypothetical protein DIT68_16010 [Brumimicrobium oceani]